MIAWEAQKQGGGFLACTKQTEAYTEGVVDTAHCTVVKVSHFFLKPRFVYRSYLLKKYNAVFRQTDIRGAYIYVGG